MSRNTKFALALGAAAILFMVVGFSLFQSIEETSSKKELAVHTMDVLEEINGLMMFNFEQESVFRGQLIYPEENFIVGFHKGKTKFQNSLYQLTKLVKDNPLQMKNIDSLKLIYESKQNSYNEILFADSSILEPDMIKSHIAEVNNQSNRFKGICNSMAAIENSLLEERETEFEEQLMKSKRMLVFTFTLTLILIITFLFVITKNFIAISRAKNELELKNTVLMSLSDRFESSLRQSKVAAFDWTDTSKEDFWISNSMFPMLEMEPEDFEATVTGFFSKHMHPDDTEDVQQQFVNHLEFGATYNPEYRLQKKNGDYISFRAIGSSKVENGRTRMTGVIMNIEKEVVERARYQNLFKNSLEAIFLTNNELEITEFNSSFRNLMKFKEDKNLSLSSLFLKKDQFERLKHELLQGKSYYTKAELKNGAGKVLIVNITCWPIVHESIDGQTSFQGEIHDITELENTQQKLMETEKLNLTGRMARIIGHEVRNPLTNIILASEELLQEEIREDERELLGIVKRNSLRISKLIDDLLNSTKLLELSRSKVVLQHVVSSAIEKCQDRIALKRINLKTYGLDQTSLIYLDQEKFQIALVNIIINSTEAMSNTEHPELIISVRSNGHVCEVSIQDNGCGMSEETKKKIFDPFYTARNGGLGLGMTNVKNILLQHNAELYLESELNEGSTFLIRIEDSTVEMNSESVE